jgi:hypothetical protein
VSVQKPGLYVAGWLLAAVIATSVGFAAVAVVTEDVAPVGARSTSQAAEDAKDAVRTTKPSNREDQRDRANQAAQDRGTGGRSGGSSSGGSGAGSADDGPTRPIRTQVTDGGVASARCTAESDALLRSWSPRSGWSVLSAEPGPTAQAVVRFTDDDEIIIVRVACVGVEPLFSVDVERVEPTEEPTDDPTDDPTSGPTGSAR